YYERKVEYDALRAAGRWSGAILYAGILLELALKLVLCKPLGVFRLPTIFRVHVLICCFIVAANKLVSRPIPLYTKISRRFKIIGR
ncbi:MAG: hypothetical protein ONB42_06375, partial [candidate division KSB1 bacterium]|nr:hypothetical protein [candidate division KSB1 bacterium]